MLTNVMELLKIQMRTIICWYFDMLQMEIYTNIYRKFLRKLLGNIKLLHFMEFHEGKILRFYYIFVCFYFIRSKTFYFGKSIHRPFFFIISISIGGQVLILYRKRLFLSSGSWIRRQLIKPFCQLLSRRHI